MGEPLRIGLLGAARIAPTAVIVPAKARDDVVVTAVAARDKAKAEAFAATHDIPQVADRYDALIHRDDVDVVYVGLPVAGHAEWTVKALEAGKAVLCEKSFCMDAAEAKAMVAAGQRAGRPLIEAYHYRFHKVMRRAGAIVASGELGRLTSARASFNVTIAYSPDEIRWRADQGGGALGDLGCYPLHALRTLIGAEPEVLASRIVEQHGVDASTWARLGFGGFEAEMGCSMIPERRDAALTITGERGQLDILNYLAPQIGCRFTVTLDGVTREEPVDGPTTYAAQLEHLVEVMAGRTEPLTGGLDAIRMMTAMDAIKAKASREKAA
jgi:predicted dehydrogenase